MLFTSASRRTEDGIVNSWPMLMKRGVVNRIPTSKKELRDVERKRLRNSCSSCKELKRDQSQNRLKSNFHKKSKSKTKERATTTTRTRVWKRYDFCTFDDFKNKTIWKAKSCQHVSVHAKGYSKIKTKRNWKGLESSTVAIEELKDRIPQRKER